MTAFLLFIKTYWKKIIVTLGIIILIATVASVYQNCKPQPKIDLETVNKINTADEVKRKDELKKTIEDNADVIKTVHEDTEIVNLSVEEKDKAIAEKVEDANKKIEEAHALGHDVTSEELECILVPAHCQ